MVYKIYLSKKKQKKSNEKDEKPYQKQNNNVKRSMLQSKKGKI